MAPIATSSSPFETKTANRAEFPVRADIHKQIYRAFPEVDVSVLGTIQPEDAAQIAATALESLSSATKDGDSSALSRCFLSEQSFWRDSVALTYHFRTFNDAAQIASNLLARCQFHGANDFKLLPGPGSARVTNAGPKQVWIDAFYSFTTTEPAAQCGGIVKLFPEKEQSAADGSSYVWKIWALSTWIEHFTGSPWDSDRIKSPASARDVSQLASFDTDVLIVGGGNSGLILGARLKDQNVDYMIIDKNARHGDNWRLRYDGMRFHLRTNAVQTPYIPYPEEMMPKFMNRDDLADQMETLAEKLKLNTLLSTTIKSTKWDEQEWRWILELETPFGSKTVRAKQLVQATGIGSQVPNQPDLPGAEKFKGVVMHSARFKNGKELVDMGAKSVIIVGSANTAFDVLEDCHHHNLNLTMLQRSPTYVVPAEYLLTLYNILPCDVVDKMTQSGPLAIGGQIARGALAMQAIKEPHRYDACREAGFQVVDVKGDLTDHIFERGGGHYVDMGAMQLIAERKVGVRSGVYPVAYTERGLELSDGTEVQRDAIVWCTGFSDLMARNVAAKIFGQGGEVIAERMDATWCVDGEGEMRGMWKRHRDIDNFWIMGGTTIHHRYNSRYVALQLKAAVEGFLPEAYRETIK